ALRKFGHSDAYEIVKEKTRGKKLSPKRVKEIINDLPLPPNEKARLRKLKPETYLGKAREITGIAVEKAKQWLDER
ncbi:MAG: hypothetical protein V5A79_01360, partial [Candidatus Bipolaricaulota bacterium]